ncbi:MAG: MATE family efflux transporter [Hyphomicrobiales bacterium]
MPSNSKTKTKVTARFVTGSIMGHVITMVSTASIGLVSIFAVDLIDLYYLSLLEDQAIIASLGLAASIMFFNMSFAIGLSIAMSATVAKAIGEKNDKKARGLALNNFAVSVTFTVITAIITWTFRDDFLKMVGAEGASLDYASRYLAIILPSLPILSLGMSGSGLVRAMGAPKMAMFAMLSGSVVNIILDPLFIFTFDMGIEGAAWASFAARISIGCSALYLIYAKHDFSAKFSMPVFKAQLPIILAIALPAMATQLASPIGNAYMTWEMAKFGEGYMAGWSLSGRLTPLVFGVLFALSGAVGPIYGQNFGARIFSRVRRTLCDSMIFVVIYSIIASVLFYLNIDSLISIFGATGEAEKFLRFTAIWIGPAFGFYSILFVANAAFNNLGYPLVSTAFNFGKATIGTIPFVMYFSYNMGAEGIFFGNGVGSVIFGISALATSIYIINKLANMNDGKGPETGFRQRSKK